MKTYEVPTRYHADTGEDMVKSTRDRLRLYTVPTAIVKILAGTFPLSADPGNVFFIISILKQSSRYRRRQRVGTFRYCYDFYYVPPAIAFFAAERP